MAVTIDSKSNELKTLGSYEFCETRKATLGTGAFGAVIRGVNTVDNSPVAIKKIHAKEFDRASDEAETLKQAKSKYVTRMLDLFTQGQFVYIVMELCDNDLGQVLEENGPLSTYNMDRVAKSVALGYMAVSELGIVHRDIKPQNILICFASSGQIDCAKLTDFGFCRAGQASMKQLVRCKTMIGTPVYMAPEIAANILVRQTYTGEVDMWSIGVVFFEAACGKWPFSENDQCRQILYYSTGNFEGYDPPEFEAEFMDKIPDYLSDTVTQLLQLDPSKRPKPKELCNLVHADKLS